jgi:hypothetical protein
MAVGNAGENFEGNEAVIAELVARGKLPNRALKLKAETAQDAGSGDEADAKDDDAASGDAAADDPGAPA